MGADLLSATATIISSLAAILSLWIGYRSLGIARDAKTAASDQASSALEALRLAVRPYIAVYSRSYIDQSTHTYLFIENVGSGSAINVKVKIIEGQNFNPLESIPLSEWKPIERGVEVIRQRERIYTLLLDTEISKGYLQESLVISTSFEDIDGRKYRSGPFKIDLLPGGGTQWASSEKTQNGKKISTTLWKPSEP